MSRIGRLPVPVPDGVQVEIKGAHVRVKGPKGELSHTFPAAMKITYVPEEKAIKVERPSDERQHRAWHGMTRALINNMVLGVTQGFEKMLEVVGVGYRAEVKGKNLVLHVGYSHPVEIVPPEGITFEVEGNTKIRVKGIDKQKVGQVAANVRQVRPPEPYKGKGIRYLGEQVRRKAGKTAK